MLSRRVSVLLALFAGLLLSGPLPAQLYPTDLIGVTFAGDAVLLHSYSGYGDVVGPTGFTGHNCMARCGGRLYTTEQALIGTTTVRFLDQLDDVTGQATRGPSISRDLRGLAARNATTMWGVADGAAGDELVIVNAVTGVINVVGPIGFANVQGLTERGFALYGWDTTMGLIRINTTTGAGVDVFPGTDSNGPFIQFLTTMSDGRILGGRHGLYTIDVGTGIIDYACCGNFQDLRGVEERFGVTYTFGQSCGSTLTLTGAPQSPTTITTSSNGHLSGGLGLLFVGFNEHQYRNVALPLALDALLGTVGCVAHAGPDISSAAVASASGVLTVPIVVPAGAAGLIFYVQHLSLSNAPGGLTFSNGGVVRLRL